MRRIILSIIAIFLLIIMIYTGIRVNYIENKNKELKNKIITIKKDTDKEKENNVLYESKLDSLKEESNGKLEELEIWKKAVKRLEEAL